MMKRYFFLPLKERGDALLGVVCTFLASGLIHSYIFVSVSVEAALSIFLFFLLQAILWYIEFLFHIKYWCTFKQQIWMFFAIGLSSPFIAEPVWQSLQ